MPVFCYKCRLLLVTFPVVMIRYKFEGNDLENMEEANLNVDYLKEENFLGPPITVR